MRAAILAFVLLAPALVAGCAGDAGDQTDDEPQPDYVLAPEDRPTAILETNRGTIEIELYSDMAPQTVQNFGQLAQDGFYDKLRFHRVIGPESSPPDGFMIQGGDPNTYNGENRSADCQGGEDGWGCGGPGYSILDEFPCRDGSISNEHPGDYRRPADQCDGRGGFQVTHDVPGTLSMANSGARSGGSQFFLTLTQTPHLDGYHTVFGTVTEGLDVVQRIGSTETDDRDRPVEDVIIGSVTIEGDLPGVELQTFED